MSTPHESDRERIFRHDAFAGWIGVARIDITPPIGIYCRNWGAAEHDAATGVHRPLTLTALSLQAGQHDEPLVLIDADASWFRSVGTAVDFRQRILARLGFESARLLFAITHTHASPPLTDEFDPDWEGGPLLAPYLARLETATVDAATQAVASAERATLTWHTGRCSLATTRDLVDPDASRQRRICGFDPMVAGDDTLVVGRITNASGGTMALLCNYACHPTTLAWENTLLSPDYVGAARETVERETGGLLIFMQGASGELAPRRQHCNDTQVADRHGRQLGYAVLATLADMESPGRQLAFGGAVESGAPLAVWREESCEPCQILAASQFAVELPLKDWPTAEALEQQRLAATDRVTQERLLRKRNLRRSLGDGTTFQLPVWAWRIGDAMLVGNMAESYAWMQQSLRASFPHRTIAYLNLVNGSIGYLPPAPLYDEDVYQVWQTPFERGSLERTGAAVARALADLDE